ncbi:U-megalopygitoxin(1)-Mo1-like [Epargyreus clarus]|uniref:U-megalopygitoxin(1)-Mo1-like n=1 Tax=Epargyreus clarus TaxID=520877 RepID=UPI003C2C58C2
MLRSLVVFLALISVALAGLMGAPLEPKPDKYKDVEGCYIADLGRVLAFGESAPSPKYCQEYRCSNNYYGITTVTCGTGSTSPPCVMVADSSKPYPHCCPQIKCP